MAEYVFFSWQTDSPRRENTDFIEEALNLTLAGTDRVVDFATRERGGAVDISASIFRKISECAFAVFDVTPVTRSESGRAMPNPNVLIELGYAGRAIGWERSLLVSNTCYFSLEELPFDIRGRRCLGYDYSRHAPEVLAGKLRYAIQQAENEHLSGLADARARLTSECMDLLMQIPEDQTYFSMRAGPEVLRLLDLHLIRADYNFREQLYAYHFTPLGRDLRRAAFQEAAIPSVNTPHSSNPIPTPLAQGGNVPQFESASISPSPR